VEERERSGKLSPEIYVYATNKHFFNLYDALRINKIKIEIAGYDPATNRQTGHASAWLDADDARLLSHLACNRLFAAVTGGKWEKYGGSQRDDGSIESRTVMIEWDEGENGRFARFPYRITISNGPGKKTATGGVAPAGDASARLTMRLPELDMMKLMLALGDYIHAYETAHHHRLVAERIRDLRDKLADRPGRATQSVEAASRSDEPAVRDRVPERPAAAASSVGSAGRPPLRAMRGGVSDGLADRRINNVRAG
jgi:hypothetical protein